MKKIILILVCILNLTNINAHTLLMNVFDNEDDTITIEGQFSNGELAIGAMIRLESLNSGKVLYKKRLPDLSELTVSIPKEEYQIVLDGGPGHQIVKEGIEPLNGFLIKSKNNKEEKIELSKERSMNMQWNNITIVLLSIAFILIFLTLYFSSKNTNKILKQIKELNT